MDKKALILKQKTDEDIWVKIRNLAWKYDKELFDNLDKNTFDIVFMQTRRNGNKVLEYKKWERKG